MAGLSRSEYERTQAKHAQKGSWPKFLWRVFVLALMLVLLPVLLPLLFGLVMVTTIVLGNWKMSVDLPDFR